MKKHGYLWVFLFFLSAYLLLIKGYPLFVDEAVMYESAVNLVEYGSPHTIPHPWTTKPGRDGLNYSNYGIGQSLLQVPFYLAARPFLPHRSPDLDHRRQTAVFPMPAIIAALIALITFRILTQLGYGFRSSFQLTLLLGFGTMIWPYSKMLFRDPLQTLLLLASVMFLVTHEHEPGNDASNRTVWFSGLCMAFAITVKETMGMYALFLFLYLFRSPRNRTVKNLVAFGVPILAGIAVCLMYNYYRFGALLDFGYTKANIRYGLSAPFIEGFYGQLFSAGGGFFIYNPLTVAAILSFPRFITKHRGEAFLFGGIILTAVLFHSKYWSWGGGWAWGPRYLLVIVPFMVIPLAASWSRWMQTGWKRRGIVVLIVLSIAVQIPGVLMHVGPFFSMMAHDVHLFPLTHEEGSSVRSDMVHVDFIPQFSPIWGLFWTMKHAFTMPFLSAEQIRDRMIANCPWRSLSPDWVPDHPETALGMGPDLLGVAWHRYWPETAVFVWVYYSLCAAFLCISTVHLRRIG